MKTPTQADLDAFVRNNVHYCVSALVSTLAMGYPYLDDALHQATVRGTTRVMAGQPLGNLSELAEQASELTFPVDDYEEAALQAGWKWDEPAQEWRLNDSGDGHEGFSLAANAQALCEEMDIEPYSWEIYEHWIVSDWLADRLEAHGERVDKDFAGLTVWGRTTTGQAISMDAVIEKIWTELHKEG